MKTTILTLLALMIGLSALNAQTNPKSAQTASGPRKVHPPLVVSTLDANGDGIIDAVEIARASEALKSLDKNGDGKLSTTELRRARPTSAAATPAVESAPKRISSATPSDSPRGRRTRMSPQ